jgi:3-dehydroquinate dehydratase I
MNRIKICATVTVDDFDLISGIDRFVDLYEIRIDLIGDGWQEWVGKLQRPWIATNRLLSEGGKWKGNEADRIAKLMEAVKLGARIVDIELGTNDLNDVVPEIKKNKIECLISTHNLQETPSFDDLAAVVKQEMAAGADICKIVTTAKRFEDNMTMLRLFETFKGVKVVAFAMGSLGIVSRVLSPIVGGYFTYASVVENRESASGQLTATYLRSLYEAIRRSHD